jgi:MFS transporter, DHA1 family, tetracycline resistance protein
MIRSMSRMNPSALKPSIRERFRAADPRLITIFLIVFVQMLGSSMVLPIFPLYARRLFELRPEVITLLLSTFFAAQFVAGPFIGRLSDHYGRVPVLVISQLGTALSFAAIGAAQAAYILFLARLFDGITGGNVIVAQAYITDITPRERRTQSLGIIFAAFGLGFVFGPALGGVMSALVGPRIPFYVAAVAAFATAILTQVMLDETVSAEQRIENRRARRSNLKPRAILSNRPLVLILLLVLIAQFGFGILISVFSLHGEAVLFSDYTQEATDLGIGLLLAVIGFSQVLTQSYLIGPMLRRFNESVGVVYASFLRGFSLLILALIASPWWAVPSMILFAVGNGIGIPAVQALATDTVPDSERGAVLGLVQSFASLAVIFSTALAGYLFQRDVNFPYWLATVLYFGSILPGIFLHRWQAHHRHVAVAVPAD